MGFCVKRHWVTLVVAFALSLVSFGVGTGQAVARPSEPKLLFVEASVDHRMTVHVRGEQFAAGGDVYLILTDADTATALIGAAIAGDRISDYMPESATAMGLVDAWFGKPGSEVYGADGQSGARVGFTAGGDIDALDFETACVRGLVAVAYDLASKQWSKPVTVQTDCVGAPSTPIPMFPTDPKW